jgi:hypothetical protein
MKRGRRIRQNTCPWCGYKTDAVSSLESTENGFDLGARMPREGDITLCIGPTCGEWNVFTSDLTLRKPTDAELLEIGNNDGCRAMRTAWWRMNQENQP